MGRRTLSRIRIGHLVYARGGTLVAQPFDGGARRTSVPPVPVGGAELTTTPAFYPSAVAVSPNGVMVFQAAADVPSELTWLDAQGRERGTLPVKYSGPTLSPDGRRLAGSCEGPHTGTLSICVFDLARGVGSRISAGPGDRFAAWSHDGREIAFASDVGIARVPSDGSRPRQIVSWRGNPTGWLPDGRILSFGIQRGAVSLALASPESQEVTELGPGAEPQLSPDTAWLAYLAPAGLVVQRFPSGESRRPSRVAARTNPDGDATADSSSTSTSTRS